MNKKFLKRFLFIIGLILLFVNFIICFINERDIFFALFTMAFETFAEFGELESILSILGTIFLGLGLIIKQENEVQTVDNNKNLIVKYKILRALGYLPFIGSLCFAIYSSIFGFSFLFSTSYGIEAFFGTIFLISLFIWPLYIIGAIIIIKSSSKINDFNKSNGQNSIEKDKE